MRAIALLAVLCSFTLDAQTLVVETVAGSRNGGGFTEGAGAKARFSGPARVALCGGVLYVAETGNHVIRRVTRAGVVTTWAGAGAEPGSADGDRFTARFRTPSGIAADERCGLYVADSGNHTIRRISPEGVVTTIAGAAGASGAIDGAAADARFFEPSDVALAADGTLFICDRRNFIIRTLANGQVGTLAGSAGKSGAQDGTGSAARFAASTGLAIANDGALLVADMQSQTLRRVTREGAVTTLAKIGFAGDIDVAPDGTIYVADEWNTMISRVAPDGTVSTVAGLLARSEHRDGRGEAARFLNPVGIAYDRDHFLWVTDTRANAIRIITLDGETTTLAGSVAVAADSPFSFLNDVAEGPDGVIYASDFSGLNRIAPDGTVTRIASVPGGGIAVAPNGDVIMSDISFHVIRRITPAGVATIIAGTSGQSGLVDGRGANARFNSPYDVAVGADGTVYVADTLNRAMRRIAGDQVTTIPHDRNGLSTPVGLDIDAESNLYFWDENAAKLFKVTQAGVRTTLATGPGLGGWMGRVARTDDGTFYIAAWRGDAIRRITADGTIEVFAGDDFGPGNQNSSLERARFSRPSGIDVTRDGTILLADVGSFAVRAIRPTTKPVISSFNATTTRLTWSTRNATSARIEPGIGAVPLEGSRNIAIDTSTEYTLIVTNAEGEARETAFVVAEKKKRAAR